jgi:hypothetical protein
MLGPKAVLCRGTCSNYTSFASDVRAAYQNALMCWLQILSTKLIHANISKGYITKDQGHWTTATTILDSWGTNLTNIIGTDTSLLIGLDGSIMANAAEIMRWEGNWTEAGAHWYGGSGFSNQLYWLFARQSIIIGQANYGMVSIKALLDFAVYLDDVSMVSISQIFVLPVLKPPTYCCFSITTLSIRSSMTLVLAYMAISIQQPANHRNPAEIKVTPLQASLGQHKQHVPFNRKAGISMGWATT